MNEGIKREIEQEIRSNGIQDTAFYDVYKTSTGLYLPKEICDIYYVGDRDNSKEIKNRTCYKVNDQDLSDIRSKSSRQEVVMFPNIITIFDLQLTLTFTVLVDSKHNNRLYIPSTLAEKYNVNTISKRFINGLTYSEVTEKDLDTIEEASLKEKIKLKRHYQTVELEDEMKPAEFLFIYYHDFDTEKAYVDRKMYELIRKNGIEIEANPKIIDDKNCYSVTNEDLKTIEDKMGYRGVEQLLKPKRKDAPVIRKANFPNMTIINQVIDNITSFQKTHTEPETTVPKTVEEPKQESILVYKNQKTHQLFVPVEEVPETNQLPVQVMNKSCYETSMPELEAITNKKIIVAEYYPAAKEDLDVIICNHKGHLFISKSVLEQLGFYIEDPHRIMISGDIYEEITDDDIDLIKEKDSDTFHINIIMKQIAPKRG